MTEFKKSILLTISICGCITATAMFLSVPFAHMSLTAEQARTASFYVAGFGLPVIVISLVGIFTTIRTGMDYPVTRGARTSRYAIASIILGFPMFGLMTWGLSSLAGITTGFIALRRIYNSNELNGKRLAILGICFSFCVLPFIVILTLFLGP